MPNRTMRFYSVLCGCAHSAKNVLVLGNGLQMLRIHTSTIAAKVVKLLPSWDITLAELISNPVSRKGFAASVKRSVTSIGLGAGPDQALPSSRSLGPKSHDIPTRQPIHVHVLRFTHARLLGVGSAHRGILARIMRRTLRRMALASLFACLRIALARAGLRSFRQTRSHVSSLISAPSCQAGPWLCSLCRSKYLKSPRRGQEGSISSRWRAQLQKQKTLQQIAILYMVMSASTQERHTERSPPVSQCRCHSSSHLPTVRLRLRAAASVTPCCHWQFRVGQYLPT